MREIKGSNQYKNDCWRPYYDECALINGSLELGSSVKQTFSLPVVQSYQAGEEYEIDEDDNEEDK